MITHTLPDGGWIEASCETRGANLRLRARLVEPTGLVDKALMHTYAANDPNAFNAFTREWEELTPIRLARPLFVEPPAVDLTPELAADAALVEIEDHRTRSFVLPSGY